MLGTHRGGKLSLKFGDFGPLSYPAASNDGSDGVDLFLAQARAYQGYLHGRLPVALVSSLRQRGPFLFYPVQILLQALFEIRLRSEAHQLFGPLGCREVSAHVGRSWRLEDRL